MPTTNLPSVALRTATFLALAAFAAACKPSPQFGEAKTVSTAQRPTAWDMPLRDRFGLSSGASGKAETEQGSWSATTPPGWEQLPAQPNRFRDLLFRVAGEPDTECYLTANVGGGIRMNLERWYVQQAGQAQAPAPEALPEVEFAGGKGRYVELVGTISGKADQAMLVVFRAEGDRMTSLKFNGPAAKLLPQKDTFLTLAKSLRQGAPAAVAAAWTAPTPAGWELLPAQPERFRDLLFKVGDGECYLTASVGGGVGMNLQRWYVQQAGQAEAPAPETLPEVEFAGGKGRFVELFGTISGKAEQGMLIVFAQKGDAMSTLKFTGSKTVVAAEKERFLQLAAALRLGGAAQETATKPSTAPATQPNANPATPTNSTPSAPTGPFTATVPGGWTPKAGSTKPLHHTFGAEGELYVSQLGGGLRPMFDIWRSEVGGQPLTDEEFAALPKQPMLGGDGLLLDASGQFRSMQGKTIADARLLVAAHEGGGTITFVKLVGRADEVAGQLDAFRTFCASLTRTP
ncbi:MAG: hypothetical protein RL398_1199 [Planctomycetota bacterium]|jgi:hypothetical protein